MQKSTVAVLGVMTGIGATFGVAKLIRDRYRKNQGPYYEFNRGIKQRRNPRQRRRIKKLININNQQRDNVEQQAQQTLDQLSGVLKSADDGSFRALNVEIK